MSDDLKPIDAAVLEFVGAALGALLHPLLQAIACAEGRAERLLQAGPEHELQPGDLDDHRTAVAGDLADALERLQPGLGDRLMAALYPELDLSLPPNEAAALVLESIAAEFAGTPAAADALAVAARLRADAAAVDATSAEAQACAAHLRALREQAH